MVVSLFQLGKLLFAYDIQNQSHYYFIDLFSKKCVNQRMEKKDSCKNLLIRKAKGRKQKAKHSEGHIWVIIDKISAIYRNEYTQWIILRESNKERSVNHERKF